MPDSPMPGSAGHHLATLALGANRGKVRETLGRALRRLAPLSPLPPLCSSLWITTPVDCPPGSPPFVNAVMQLRLPRPADPRALLDHCLETEGALGRRRGPGRNRARPIDIDLIAFDDLRSTSDTLTLPHPRAHRRYFVLAPLCEIAPDLVLAGSGRTVRQWLSLVPVDPGARRIPGPFMRAVREDSPRG